MARSRAVSTRKTPCSRASGPPSVHATVFPHASRGAVTVTLWSTVPPCASSRWTDSVPPVASYGAASAIPLSFVVATNPMGAVTVEVTVSPSSSVMASGTVVVRPSFASTCAGAAFHTGARLGWPPAPPLPARHEHAGVGAGSSSALLLHPAPATRHVIIANPKRDVRVIAVVMMRTSYHEAQRRHPRGRGAACAR